MRIMDVRQYAIVSKQSIELWVDSLGSCKVPDDIFSMKLGTAEGSIVSVSSQTFLLRYYVPGVS